MTRRKADPTTTVTLRLPASTLQRARALAALTGLTSNEWLKAVIFEAIRQETTITPSPPEPVEIDGENYLRSLTE